MSNDQQSEEEGVVLRRPPLLFHHGVGVVKHGALSLMFERSSVTPRKQTASIPLMILAAPLHCRMYALFIQVLVTQSSGVALQELIDDSSNPHGPQIFVDKEDPRVNMFVTVNFTVLMVVVG